MVKPRADLVEHLDLRATRDTLVSRVCSAYTELYATRGPGIARFQYPLNHFLPLYYVLTLYSCWTVSHRKSWTPYRL